VSPTPMPPSALEWFLAVAVTAYEALGRRRFRF